MLPFAIAAYLDVTRGGLGERRRQAQRERAGRPAFGSVGRDLAHALRALRKSRGLAAVSIVSLGIGIGVAILMLVVTRARVGRPPGVDPGSFVELLVIPQGSLRAQVNDWAIDTWSYPDFTTVRDANTGVTVTGWTPAQAIVRPPEGTAVRVDAMYVSPNYFETLGLRLARTGIHRE